MWKLVTLLYFVLHGIYVTFTKHYNEQSLSIFHLVFITIRHTLNIIFPLKNYILTLTFFIEFHCMRARELAWKYNTKKCSSFSKNLKYTNLHKIGRQSRMCSRISWFVLLNTWPILCRNLYAFLKYTKFFSIQEIILWINWFVPWTYVLFEVNAKSSASSDIGKCV